MLFFLFILDTMLREESSDQSILAVMTRFVQAVSAMDDTVMIPMRLKDLPDEQGKQQKVSYLTQGSHRFWKSGKSGKIGRHFSSQGKVREFGIFFENQGILMTQYFFYILMRRYIFITDCILITLNVIKK